ncbi:MAG: hydrogen peroxide-dependent heme synthase [Solirubrobacteraceae bacterium]
MTTTSPNEDLRAGRAFPAGLTYTAYAAFRAARVRAELPRNERAAIVADAERVLSATAGVAVRGAYDTAGYRADVDLMVWLAGPSADALQDALGGLRRSTLGLALEPFWTSIGVHREAEFSKSHVPAFYAGEPARRYLCVYPFVRTPEWYLLAPEQRRTLLAEHGRMGRDYPDVRANTVSAFGLGDYEWLLAFEADDLVRIVDLIRHLRGSAARLYTKNELPFITGVRKPLAEIIDALP